MLQLMPGAHTRKAKLTRRDLMRMSALGTLGLGLGSQLDTQLEAAPIAGNASAKNCIYIFLCGGPSQLDMWDPKPDAPDNIRGPFKPISTNVPGIQIGDLLPQVAQHADKLAIVRSMHHDTNSHDLGILRTLLADKSQLKKAYPPKPSDRPGLGALLSYLYGAQGQLPPWVVLPRFFTTGARFYRGQTAGFLGDQYESFELGAEKKASLKRTEFHLENLNLSKSGQDIERLTARKNLLGELTQDDLASSPNVKELDGLVNRAYNLFASQDIRQVFDVRQEKQQTRERYGMNEYGQSFLLARRLVEANVRMVNLFWTFYGDDGCQFNLWDNHGSDKEVCGGKNRGVDMIRHDYCCPSFDKAFSALLQDLEQRGLLESTLVVVTGEFGRTPKINKNAGRDHWSSCYSTVLAGGGIQGGSIYGRSDRQAAYVADRPVTPFDMHATILHAFGVPRTTMVPDNLGRPLHVTDGNPITDLF